MFCTLQDALQLEWLGFLFLCLPYLLLKFSAENSSVSDWYYKHRQKVWVENAELQYFNLKCLIYYKSI